jgi:hypothetical protein
MTKKSRRGWGWISLLIVVLVACRPGTPTRTPQAEPVTGEPAATRTAEPAAAATATSTPLPTAALTPTPMPTPVPTPIATPVSTESAVADYERAASQQRAAMRPEFAGDVEALGTLTRYSIEVTADPGRALVKGNEAAHYVNRDTVSQTEIYFRLFPNLRGYGGEMTVSNVRVDGRAAETELLVERTALRIPLPEPLAPGEEALIELDFQASVPQVPAGYGQFIVAQDIMALANFFPLIPAFDLENCALFDNCDGGWNIEYPVPNGDAVFSETVLFDVLVTAPAGWTVVASGSTVGQETNAAGDVTWHIVTGPTRDLNVVLSSRFQVMSREVDGTVVNSYYLPEDEAGGKRTLGWGARAVAFFNEQFGPYPFAEFDIVETPNIAGGIEYPGLIAMPIQNYEQTGGFFEWATVHEVAHQWWYSVVGNDQQDEPWLDEALVQYSTALYFESEEGWADAVDEVLRSYYEPVAGTAEDKSFTLPVKDYSESTYGPLVYGKGPLFFHAVREEAGLETFYRILETYYATYRYQVASGQDWLDLANQVTDGQLTALYAEWIPGTAGSQ